MICHLKKAKQTSKNLMLTTKHDPCQKREAGSLLQRVVERYKAIEKNRRCVRVCAILLPWQQ